MSEPYWTVSEGPAVHAQTCRECRNTIYKGQDVKVRSGRKIRLFYHPDCFSGSADPRTQSASSFHDPRYSNAIGSTAPKSKGAGKWSVDDYGYMPSATGLGGGSSGSTGGVAKAAGPGSGSGSRTNVSGGSRAGSFRDLNGGGK
ncbi:hypothetical protein HK097_003951 [Rhizophlyctis rosea]|uniref:PARP-type domain-containing protein n=1 Tax=Rhizophlyctis rosea TaxID=64517 RepID=A0AAD5X6N0_9FUNG|nr:hypothetical protein HK097_003951 [Rhizophlyctis rosea]